MNLLAGKTAIITGAARGIGREITIEFAKQGANIAFICRKPDDNSKSLEDELKTFDVKTKAYYTDVADFKGVHDVVAEVAKDFQTIDVLINNAGITKDGLMMRMTEEQWDSVINVNLKSAFNFVHACTPIMMKQRKGSIINMSSVVGLSGNAGQTNYAASKAGLSGMTKSLAKELGSRGIRANTICPGFILTDMTGVLNEDVKKQWESQIPLKRGGEANEVAKVAVFLASDLSSYVTGQDISVCGGMNV